MGWRGTRLCMESSKGLMGWWWWLPEAVEELLLCIDEQKLTRDVLYGLHNFTK